MWNFNCISHITKIPLVFRMRFCSIPADLCATTIVPADETVSLKSKDLFDSSSVVLVSTYCQSGVLTLVSKIESTASGMTTDDKTATIHVMSLAGINNMLAHYKQSCGYIKYHMHYPIFMACMAATP